MFFERKDEVTKGFLYRVEIPEQEFTVEVDGAAAKIAFLAVFHEVHGEQSQLAWKAKIRAQLVKTDDGWKIRRSENESLEGTRLR